MSSPSPMSPMQGQHQCSASQQQPSSKGDSEKHRPTIHSYELHYPHHDLHLQYGHGAWEHENDDDRVHPLLPTTTSPHSPACTTFMSNASAASSSPFTSSASSSFSSTCSFLVPSSSPRDPHATAMDSAVPYASLDTLPHQKQHQFLRQEQQQPLHEPVLERTLSSAVAASMTPTIASRYPLEKPSIGAAHEAVSTLSTPSTPHEATRPTLIPQGQDSRRERFQAQPMARQFSSSSSSSSISSSAPMSPTTQTLVERTECETSFISHPWTAAKSSSNSSASSTSSSSLASSYAKVGLQWAYLPTLEDTQAAAPSPSSSIATVDPDDRHHPHTAATTAATTPSPWSSTPHRRCLWPPESTMITSSTPSTFNTVVSPKHVGTSTQPNRSASPPSSPRATLSASMARSRISQAAAERMQPEYLYPNIDSQILFLPSGSSHSSSGGNIRSNRATLINPRSMVREENLAAAGISPLGSSDQGRFGEHPPGSQSDLLWQHRQRNIIEASQPQYLQQRLRALEIQEVKIMQRRRQQDEPTYRERNNAQVRCLIQEAVEHGIGEIDLSNHELDDLPPDIVDLSCAIIHNERGSLLCNKLQLYLSYNLFTTVPKSIFSLKNLSVLSLRNNHLTEIPPEIGLLQNLVELSIGGNQLKYLPWQVTQLSKLVILNVHPNPFLMVPEDEEGNAELPATLAIPWNQEMVTPTTPLQVLELAEGEEEEQEEAIVLEAEPLSLPLTISMAELPPEPAFSQEHVLSSSTISPSSSSPSSSSTMATSAMSASAQPAAVPMEELFAIGVERPASNEHGQEDDRGNVEEGREEDEEDGEEDQAPPLRARIHKQKFPSLKVIAGTALLRTMLTAQTQGSSKTSSQSTTAMATRSTKATVAEKVPASPPSLVQHEDEKYNSHQTNDKDEDNDEEEDDSDGQQQPYPGTGPASLGCGRSQEDGVHVLRRRKKRTHSVSWDIDHLRPQPSRPKAEALKQDEKNDEAMHRSSDNSSPTSMTSPLSPGLGSDSARKAKGMEETTFSVSSVRVPSTPATSLLCTPPLQPTLCSTPVDRPAKPLSSSSSSSSSSSMMDGEAVMIWQRTKMQALLTPYLFEAMEHAIRTRQVCPGCGQAIWKSCRRTLVWQEVVGQVVRVPIEYRGCGLGSCPGLPRRLRKRVRMYS